MNEEQQKQLSKEIRGQLLPLFVGLRNELKQIVGALDGLLVKQPPEVQKTEVINHPEPVRTVGVDNFPDIQKVEVLNHPEPPKEIAVKGIGGHFKALGNVFTDGIAWLSRDLKEAVSDIKAHVWRVKVDNPVSFPDTIGVHVLNVKDLKQEPPTMPSGIKILNSEPKDAIPVVLTSHDRKRFYSVLQQLAGTTDINLDGIKKKLDELITAVEEIDVTIMGSDIQIGAVEIKDGDSDTRMDVESDPVATTKNAAFVQAPSLLAELVAIKGFLDTVETKLQAIADNTDGLEGFVDGLEGFTDGIEGLLTSISGFVDELEGFTDTLEAKLQTLIDQQADNKDYEQSLATAGKVYNALTNIITVISAAETDFFLFKNPSASGKTAIMGRFVCVFPQSAQSSIFRVYKNPTITADGAAITITPRKSGAAASVMSAFSLPTISARGTLISLRAADINEVIPYNYSFILNPGDSLLVTVDASSVNLEHALNLIFAETI